MTTRITTALGGPGLACSGLRVRRLLAGELAGAERSRAEEHLAGCARCQGARAEVEGEGRALAELLPFERFAAGVAERMAAATAPAGRSGWPWRLLPLALAAGLAAVVAVPLVGRRTGWPAGEAAGVRSKGGASLSLFLQLPGQEPRALAAGEPVPARALLRPSLQPGRWRQAALLLADADGTAVLYQGPARPGPIGEAFAWTGEDARGALYLLLAEAPIDLASARTRLARGEPPLQLSGAGEVVVLPLQRESR